MFRALARQNNDGEISTYLVCLINLLIQGLLSSKIASITGIVASPRKIIPALRHYLRMYQSAYELELL